MRAKVKTNSEKNAQVVIVCNSINHKIIDSVYIIDCHPAPGERHRFEFINIKLEAKSAKP